MKWTLCLHQRYYYSSPTTNSDSSEASPPPLHDPYNKYRQTSLTEDVWREIQEENESTRRSIDVQLYEKVVREIMQAQERIPPPCPELGVTGKYLYDLYDNAITGRRTYRRQDATTTQGPFQTVLEVPMDEYNLQSLSLSVDESLVAGLLEPLQQQQSTSSTEPQTKNVILLRHIDSGEELQLELPTTTTDLQVSSLEWGPMQTNGDHSFFYVTNDPQGLRPDSVWACTIASHYDDDGVAMLQQLTVPSRVYHVADSSVMVHVQRTKGCQYVSIQAHTKTDSEILLCTNDTSQPPKLVRPRQERVVYHLDVGSDGKVYLLISDNNNNVPPAEQESPTSSTEEEKAATAASALGPELSLFQTTIDALPLPAKGAIIGASRIAGSREGYIIADMDIFQDFIALYERSTMDGTQRLRILQQTSSPKKEEEVPSMYDNETIVPIASSKEACATFSPGGNMHYRGKAISFMVDSPSFPARTYEFDVLSNKLRMVSNASSSDNNISKDNSIHQRRVMVSSPDGTQVPLSLVYRELPNHKSTSNKGDATRPAVLMGYGAYGEPMNLSFDPTLQPLLDRDFILAFAHTRGGGDLGKAWYHGGRHCNKPKAVEDFVACAHALSHELGLTKPHKLTAKAFSAGGVVVGAAVNQHPELFGNVVLTNAFLDVQKTMENDALYLTQHEWDEYGNPAMDPLAAEAIASYCPVSNASNMKEHKARFLLIGAFDDAQVPFWNAIIYGKKVRQNSRSKRDVYLHIESHGGHHLQGSRLHVAALEAAFIIGNRAAYFGMRLD